MDCLKVEVQKKADGVAVRLGIDTGGVAPDVVLPQLLTSVAIPQLRSAGSAEVHRHENACVISLD
jgi:hypothetical protein